MGRQTNAKLTRYLTLMIHHRMCIVVCMRTNIHLDDELLQQAARYSTARSKRALVHEALSVYVVSKDAERKRASYGARLEKLRAQLVGVHVRTHARAIVRADRERRA